MTIRIMSNNLWWCDGNAPAWKAQGEDCSAQCRSVGFFKLYQETMPDILGLQECSAQMAAELMTRIAESGLPYGLLWGRDTPILYRWDKFEVVESQAYIYPEEIPGYPGSFNNLKTKSYCMGVFRNKADGKLLIFATTHLWWKSSDMQLAHYQPYSDEARTWQLNLLLDRAEALQRKYQCPIVVVGDLNGGYHSPAVQSALQRGYAHGHDVAVEYADESTGLHNCSQDGFDTQIATGGFLLAIDHILIKDMQNSVGRFERYSSPSYMLLSDHLPVWIDVDGDNE